MTAPATVEIPTSVGATRLYLSANDRLHWAAKAKRTRYWRNLARVVARAEHLDRLALAAAQVDVTFSWPDRRRRDVGNLYPTAKALLDGLVDAHALPDDDDRHVTGPFLHRGHGSLSITITLTPREVLP